MFWPNFLVLLLLLVVVAVVVCWCLLVVPVGSACWWCLFVCVWWVCSGFLDPSAGPPSAGPPKIWLFFFPFPPSFRSFCVSLGVFSWNFGGVLKRSCPEMCTFGLSGCRVRAPALVGPPGFHTTTQEPKRAHLSAPVFKNTTKNSTKKTNNRGRKE